MNPGSEDNCPRFERTAFEYMSKQSKRDWNILESVLGGSSNIIKNAQAKRIQAQREYPAVVYGSCERRERRAISRRATATAERLALKVRNSFQQNDRRRLRTTSEKYFKSFDAKYTAYCNAYKAMKPTKRPHIGSLVEYAHRLNAFEMEFEEAQLINIEREWDRPNANRQRVLRPTMDFGIHHRARQHLILRLLQVCYSDRIRDDQYCSVGRGRDAAVMEAIHHLSRPDIEFVAECDISNFFPTIGEKNGRYSPAPTLQDQFPMLPRAVIESAMLSSGVLLKGSTRRSSSTLGLEALNRNSYARTGVPQGSALSSTIAEYVMSDIMQDAETRFFRGTDMIAYVDNIAVFGESSDDVNGMIAPLALSAESNPFGSFDLRRSQTTRHKSKGFIYLGYYLCWDRKNSCIKVDVSEKNQIRFKKKLAASLKQIRITSRTSQRAKHQKYKMIKEELQHWISSFSLAPNVASLASELLLEELSKSLAPTRLLCEPLITEIRDYR